MRQGRRCLRVAWLVALGLLACGPPPPAGPRALAFDRETCEHCQMVISDRESAVEIRLDGERRVHAFDDLGCALVWLDAQAGRASELWVRAPDGDAWVDGWEARYEADRHTPMGYGFAPAASGAAGLALEEVRTRVRTMAAERRGWRTGDGT